jgi:ABC-type bacteriocin/lantibiotic exporter with double-glycine peptidase domain
VAPPIFSSFYKYIIIRITEKTKLKPVIGSEENQMKRLNKLVTRMPISILILMCVITSMISGVLLAKENLMTAEIVTGFKWKTLYDMIIIMAFELFIRLFGKIFNKGFRAKLANHVYLKYLDKASEAKMENINKISSGKIFGLVGNMSSLVGDTYGEMICLVSAIPPFVVLIKKEWDYNPTMVLISVSSIIITVIMYAVTDKLFGWSKEGQEVRGRISAVTSDNFNNIRTIKRLKATGFARKRLLEAQDAGYNFSINIPRMVYFRVVEILCITPWIINIIICRKDLSMLAFVVVSDHIIYNVRNIIGDCIDLKVEIDGCKKNLKLLDEKEEKHAKILCDKLELKDIIFDYGNDEVKFIIDELVFENKSRTLIHGESGEGKSSLANLISGAIKPTVGTVPTYECFYIWQETEALDDSLWNNIVFNNEDNVNEEEVIELFKALNMLDWFDKLTDGFNTKIGEKGCRLSSGQKQRLNIIRLVLAFRYHPEYIFIIDEITSNLDKKTREIAIDLIDRECKSTLIAISHNEGFDKICEHSVLVENHRFICEK